MAERGGSRTVSFSPNSKHLGERGGKRGPIQALCEYQQAQRRGPASKGARGPRPGGRRLQMLGDEAGPGALARAAAMFGEQQGLLEETEPAPASRARCCATRGTLPKPNNARPAGPQRAPPGRERTKYVSGGSHRPPALQKGRPRNILEQAGDLVLMMLRVAFNREQRPMQEPGAEHSLAP